MKRFLEWIGLKERLDRSAHIPPFVSEREIWWVSFGENVGSEINGKSALFSRPGLILKKLTHNFFLVAPTTSQKREGSWYVPLKIGGKEMFICLHQIRSIDSRRLSTRLNMIDDDDFNRVKQAFWKLYK